MNLRHYNDIDDVSMPLIKYLHHIFALLEVSTSFFPSYMEYLRHFEVSNKVSMPSSCHLKSIYIIFFLSNFEIMVSIYATLKSYIKYLRPRHWWCIYAILLVYTMYLYHLDTIYVLCTPSWCHRWSIFAILKAIMKYLGFLHAT